MDVVGSPTVGGGTVRSLHSLPPLTCTIDHQACLHQGQEGGHFRLQPSPFTPCNTRGVEHQADVTTEERERHFFTCLHG